MFDYLQRLLGAKGLAPHGFCLLWDPALIWTHVISDALIGLAYFSIPVALGYFVTKRRDVAFGWVVWLFAAFILACGATHFLAIWTLWNPDYGVEGLVKAFTAIISVLTAIALWPLLPKAMALPSPAQLQRVNADLVERIGERDTALLALERANADREIAEDRLRHSQKMEAVGQLSGGIAHDFNNLLTIVVANIDRALRLPPGDARIAGTLDNALAGAERAARLTDQLLAFSRRQPLQPDIRDLNAVIREFRTLIEHTLDPKIHVVDDLAEPLWPVKVDAIQTQNTLLNLVTNARDAMPSGGTLTIRTYNVPDGSVPGGDLAAQPAGDSVALEIADTGIGMTPETMARAFEPFFTTKDLGHGTGLGLSQVYGFINQSEGRISINSEQGRGTTIRIILPRAE